MKIDRVMAVLKKVLFSAGAELPPSLPFPCSHTAPLPPGRTFYLTSNCQMQLHVFPPVDGGDMTFRPLGRSSSEETHADINRHVMKIIVRAEGTTGARVAPVPTVFYGLCGGLAEAFNPCMLKIP